MPQVLPIALLVCGNAATVAAYALITRRAVRAVETAADRCAAAVEDFGRQCAAIATALGEVAAAIERAPVLVIEVPGPPEVPAATLPALPAATMEV